MRRFSALCSLVLIACAADSERSAVRSPDPRAERLTLHGASLAANASATAPVEPSTTFLPSAIAAMPDHSGRYVVRRRDSAVFFTPEGFAIALATRGDRRGWGLHCTLAGAHVGRFVAEDTQRGTVHSFVSAPEQHATSPMYGRIAWEDAYDGIDMVAEPAPQHRGIMAYRFVVSAGAKPSDIRMHWEGATAVRATEDGRGLDVETAIGVLAVRGLRAFVVESGQRRELPVRHVVNGDEVSFAVDGWHGREPLVIDPTLAWSSYLGGSSVDLGNAVAADSSGSVVVTGYTRSADYPVLGAFDASLDGTWDAFATKITATGAIAWSSYFGGSADEFGYAVAIDATANAWVVGQQGGDAYVTKISPTGSLVWSKTLGGSSIDIARAIAFDSAGNAVVVGSTISSDFPTVSAFDSTLGGSALDGIGDAFVTKLNSSGTILWSSFLGGTLNDWANGVAIDSAGNAVISGNTNSTDFPSTGGFDMTLGGTQDAFVAKVSGTGALLWSSYLGGSTSDAANAIAVDGSGNAFVVGQAQSTDFPTTGGFDTTYGGGFSDGFLTKISGTGTLSWSTYLGGLTPDEARAVAVDASGNVVVVGDTAGSDFPIGGGFDSTYNGAGRDAFVLRTSNAGVRHWSSYLGGNAVDWGYGVAIDGSGNIFITGQTNSTNFPSTAGFDASLGGTYDAYITKLAPATLAVGAACTSDGQCVSAACADGVCCDRACTGKCEACTGAKKGSGADGTCGPIANGTDPDKECTAQSCTAGVVTKAFVCDGSGACRADGTTSCGLYFCSGTACATSCASDVDCAPAAFCSGTMCITDRDLGGACTSASQCKSGFCADGVCCNVACSGPCEACTATRKGGGTDGTCGNVAADTDPRDRCVPGTGTCAADGLCDGAGNCRSFAKAGTACGATTCSAGAVTGKVCKGDSDSCVDATTPCTPYACGSTACKTTCATDVDCVASAYCVSNACAPKAANGASCTEGRTCTSGFCADGVCCNVACTGQCESCSATKGTCSPVTGVPVGSRAKCAGEGTPCAGTCDGVNGAACTFSPGKECSATCSNAQQTIGKCDSAGACSVGAPEGCNGFACEGSTRCKTSCATEADCADKFSCIAGKCEPTAAKCSDDGLSVIDVAGKTTSCGVTRCKGGKCVENCSASDDCAPGLICNPTNKTCETAPAAAAEDTGGCGCTTAGRDDGWSLGSVAIAIIVLLRRRRVVSRS